MRSPYDGKFKGAAYAAPLAKLGVVICVLAFCLGIAAGAPRAACASGAEVYTEPYFEYISPTYSIGPLARPRLH